ncbi:MAG: tetratricopeptide repeat protein [Chitinophagaceae bacterium]|nr:tetratricopeptide repeat protein [Chitinophagaceae bacterium]
MRCLLAFLISVLFTLTAHAQTSKELIEKAKIFTGQGDFENAISALQKARIADPESAEVVQSLSFVYFLQRDFAKAIEIGKIAITMPKAEEQAYQILGLSYKSIASYREASKMYQVALKKFPNSGVIYNEYAENLALEGNQKAAIALWEEGIAKAPNFSGNYFNAVRYYDGKEELEKSMYYAEVFLNLESYSARTTEIKNILVKAYTQYLHMGSSITIEQIQVYRKELFNKFTANEKKPFLPGELYEHWKYLNAQGIFEAYNQWLLGETLNKPLFTNWVAAHPKEWDSFIAFQKSRVFKLVRTY